MRFARLFDFKTGQLLLSLTIKDELNGYLLSVETYHQGAFIKTGLAFAKLEEARASLEDFSDQKARELYHSLIKAVSEPKRLTPRGTVEGIEDWLNKSNN